MESLKEKSSKKVLDQFILPNECLEYLVNQKLFKLHICSNTSNTSKMYMCNKTILIDTNLEKCVFELLKYYGTDFKKLNEYDEELKIWKYFPKKPTISCSEEMAYMMPGAIFNAQIIFIEEICIGKLIDLNKKVIYELKFDGNFEKTSIDNNIYKTDNSFIFKYEPLEKYNVKEAKLLFEL